MAELVIAVIVASLAFAALAWLKAEFHARHLIDAGLPTFGLFARHKDEEK